MVESQNIYETLELHPLHPDLYISDFSYEVHVLYNQEPTRQQISDAANAGRVIFVFYHGGDEGFTHHDFLTKMMQQDREWPNLYVSHKWSPMHQYSLAGGMALLPDRAEAERCKDQLIEYFNSRSRERHIRVVPIQDTDGERT